MELNINLKMDKGWFRVIMTISAIIMFLILLFFNYGHPIIKMDVYENCSCPRNYIPFYEYIEQEEDTNNKHIYQECCYPSECYKDRKIPEDCNHNCMYPIKCGVSQ